MRRSMRNGVVPSARMFIRPSSNCSSTRVIARGAADVLQLVVGEPEDAELALLVEALADHLLVALLEDVERDQLAGQQHEPEREQRKAQDPLPMGPG